MRFWISWYQPTEDYRPLMFPPNETILGCWCSGWRSDPGAWMMCAVVETKSIGEAFTALQVDWPEVATAEVRFVVTHPANWVPEQGRFPPQEWMIERLKTVN